MKEITPKELIKYFDTQLRDRKGYETDFKDYPYFKSVLEILMQAEKDKELIKSGGLSDGFHTFSELYDFRKVYNACLFNEWHSQGKYDVHKSLKHNNGELCFGGGWFIVVALLPDGQISNHYENKDWYLFNVEITDKAKYPFDGHSSSDVMNRLTNLEPVDKYCKWVGDKHGYFPPCDGGYWGNGISEDFKFCPNCGKLIKYIEEVK